MLTVLSIIGTRPEAIKMAPVIKELEGNPEYFLSKICVTGQHRKMLDQVLNLFDLSPDFDLNIMKPDQDLSNLTASLFTGLGLVVKKVKPELILAQGDTTSVMVAALVAYYNKIRFGHVEAGLRTGDSFNPFPEEINRRIADNLAYFLFTPTETGRASLIAEGFDDQKIVVTGNTVIDALLATSNLPYDWSRGPLSKISRDKKIVLVTSHRRESFGTALENICMAIKGLAFKYKPQGFHFVYPVHLNPNVYNTVHKILSNIPNIDLIEPLDYLTFVHLMKHSTLILTDSGGIQEEAPSFGVPVLVMRDATERPEGIKAGVAVLVGTRCSNIIESSSVLLDDSSRLEKMSQKRNPYGDGLAAKRIVETLKQSFDLKPKKMVTQLIDSKYHKKPVVIGI